MRFRAVLQIQRFACQIDDEQKEVYTRWSEGACIYMPVADMQLAQLDIVAGFS